MDAHDCIILGSILNDGHYDMTDDDRSALQTVTHISPPPCHVGTGAINGALKLTKVSSKVTLDTNCRYHFL